MARLKTQEVVERLNIVRAHMLKNPHVRAPQISREAGIPVRSVRHFMKVVRNGLTDDQKDALRGTIHEILEAIAATENPKHKLAAIRQIRSLYGFDAPKQARVEFSGEVEITGKLAIQPVADGVKLPDDADAGE